MYQDIQKHFIVIVMMSVNLDLFYRFIWAPKVVRDKRDFEAFTYSTLASAIVVGIATYGTHIYFEEGEYLSSTIQTRAYGESVRVNNLAAVMVAYQMWNTLCCLYLPQHRTIANMVHHLITVGLGLCLFNPTYIPWYQVFYLGVAELSGIPLSVVDIQRTWPSVVPSKTFQNLANISFALAFFWFRIVMWTYTSFFFWKDSLDMLSLNISHNPFMTKCFLAGSFPMTFLQYMWGYKILKFLLKSKKKKK
jgi:hypothetical protein